MDRKGQSWSVDVVLALVIFGFVATAITSFSLLDEPGVERLQQNSQRIAVELEQPVGSCTDAILNGDNASTTGINCTFGQDYEQFRADNNVNGNFCVYFEDERGQILVFNDRNGWGSSKVLVGGLPCGSTP